MKVKLPTFVESAFLYTAANLLNALVPILLLPFLTTYLTKEDYGLVSMFQVLVMIILPFSSINSQGAIEREYFNKKYKFKPYVTSGVYLLVLSSLLITSFFLLFGSFLSSWIEFPAAFLWMIIAYCFCHSLSEVLLSVWRAENKPLRYGIFRVSRSIIEVSLSMFFVAILSKGWLGRAQGMVLSAFVFSIVAIIIFKRKGFLKVKFDYPSAKDILKFGVPLIPHTLGGVIMIYSDRIFITKMVGLSETGSYTVGYQVAMAIALLQSSFNLAWVPWFYQKLEGNLEADKQNIVKFTYIYNLFLILCAFGLTLVSPFLFAIFIHKDYYDSVQFVFWIALGFAFDGMYKMVVNYIFFVKKTYLISVLTFATAALNLILNFYFINFFGTVGAAQATALCMFIEFIAVWWISNRLYPMPWFSLSFVKRRI